MIQTSQKKVMTLIIKAITIMPIQLIYPIARNSCVVTLMLFWDIALHHSKT